MDNADFNKLTRGRIVYSAVSDMQGRGMKDRPLVVMSVPATITGDDFIEVVCGSTNPHVPENEHLTVRAPGTNQYGGHPKTGLDRTTWFYAPWTRSIRVCEIRRPAKFLPEPEVLKLQKMLEDIRNS